MRTRLTGYFEARADAGTDIPPKRRLLETLLAAAMLLCPAAADAQSNQYVYTSNTTPAQTLSGFLKNGSTGALTPAPGSPYSERFDPQQLAVDPGGKFLFVVNTSKNNVSMFQIDSTTGALTEVPKSPFSAGGGTQPQAITVSAAGKYVFVGNHTGVLSSADGSIDTYSIDSVGQALVPVASFDTVSPVIALVTDPKGRNLYAYMGENSLNGDTIPHLPVYSIDANTGKLALVAKNESGQDGRSLAMDPQGRFLFAGDGMFGGFVNSLQISAVDGSFLGSQIFSLGAGAFPESLAAESSGKFLYVSLFNSVVILSVDPSTGVLTPTSASPALTTLTQGATLVADPQGPYLYMLAAGQLRGFQVDSATGALTEIAGSPFATSGGSTGLAVTATPVQTVTGPIAAFVPASLSFGTWNVGAVSNTLITQLVNTGDQLMTINSISVTGANAADFSQTNTCGATLAVNANCSVSVTFKPAAAGDRTASLSFSDNAAGSPQTVPLSGTGVVPQPAVTLSPASLTFAAMAVGHTSAPQTVTVTNSGTATLNVSGVSLTGSNPGDFAQTNTCGGVAVGASCAITVTFTPATAGSMTAALSVTDDAAGSPHTAALSGTGDQPFTLQAAGTGSTSATVSAGQTAQFSLQLAPATGFSGSVSLTCAGAPANSVCQVSPATVQVSSSTPAPFTVSVTTTARAAVLPPPPWPVRTPFDGGRTAVFSLAFLALLWLLSWWMAKTASRVPAARPGWMRLSALLLLLTAAEVAGCGGGGNILPPAAQGTPAGTYTLMVTAVSGSLSQQLPLSLTVK